MTRVFAFVTHQSPITTLRSKIMSRLDRHVAMVQNKLALGRFVQALAWAGIVFAGGGVAGIIVDRVFGVRLPASGDLGLERGGGVACWRRWFMRWCVGLSQHDAAVAIDERLALKEKFSTALFARSMKDPFAAGGGERCGADGGKCQPVQALPARVSARGGLDGRRSAVLAFLTFWLFRQDGPVRQRSQAQIARRADDER